MPTKKERILLVGGAGYIGSHMALLLQEMGYETVIFDNLHTGFEEALFGSFYRGDLLDSDSLHHLFEKEKIDAVMHFAALTAVGESVVQPGLYYKNNFQGTLNLLEMMLKYGVSKLIFSSTAAVYGEPEMLPIGEEHPKRPCSPYGQSKWMVEQVLRDYEKLGIHSIAFRYFNACGADPKKRTGERRQPVSHLIPIVLEVAQGLRPHLEIFGTDYPTRDGSCIRDYVHVQDLCRAHLLGLKQLFNGGTSAVFNLGSGEGFTVLEVVEEARKITGHAIPLFKSARRAGDCAQLIASSEKAKRELGWQPQRSRLQDLIGDSWSWMQLLQRGCSLVKERRDHLEARMPL